MASSYNPAFVMANGNTIASAEMALAAGLESDMAYLNIHTTAFPGGEVRAFLIPVPEPVSALILLPALGLLWLRRRLAAR